MAWFKRDSDPNKTAADASAERTVKTEGLWLKCEGCREIIWKKDLELTMNVCGKCGYHFRVDARTRLILLFDDGKYLEHDAELASSDPLNFVDQKSYVDRLKAMQLATSLKDALISGSGTLAGRPVNICAMEPKFIGGSMGSVMGEKITRAVERSIERHMPLLVVSASGGARMQEGAVSLMQMAKISSALMRLDEAHVPYISILTDPTTGGVTASYAMLGDVQIAEPGALIGFAGQRVIQDTIREKLPEGFQRAEYLHAHGMIDMVVPRRDLRVTMIRILSLLRNRSPAGDLVPLAIDTPSEDVAED